MNQIPRIFHSEATGELFNSCINCDRYLLDGGVPYVIEKAIKRYPDFNTQDTIFEHAMCLRCQMELRKELSRESLARIDKYFITNADPFQRYEKLSREHDRNLDAWLEHCIIKGTTIDEESEYQIYCQCDGKEIVYSLMPFMIGGKALDEIMNLLSSKTLGEIDRLMGELFDLPPELKPVDKPVFVF
jgi:hypothetical protein